MLPFFHDEGAGFIEDATLALAYAVMALGLNIIVGFAGLLDLGYVAFYALGALTAGWFMSGFFVTPMGARASRCSWASRPPSCRASTSTSYWS